MVRRGDAHLMDQESTTRHQHRCRQRVVFLGGAFQASAMGHESVSAHSYGLDTLEKVLTDGSSGLPVGVVGPGVIGGAGSEADCAARRKSQLWP